MDLRAVVVFAGLFVYLGYYCHAPLPDDISDPWKLKVIIAGYRLAHLLTSAGEMLGFGTNLNISRVLFAKTFQLTSENVPTTGLKIEDGEIAGVPVRIYQPLDTGRKQELPVVIYYHGGGFITFSLDTYDNVLQTIARDVGAVVISVDYRLAPEHKYPAAIDDCYKVTRQILQNTEKYGGAKNRVALAGDSAGGNLAATVSWKLAYDTPQTSAKMSQPKLQVLLYPMLQAFDFQLPSYVEENYRTHEIATSEGMAACWYIYCTGDVSAPVDELMANNHTSYDSKTSKQAAYVDPWLIKNPKYQKRKAVTTQFNNELVKSLSKCITNPTFSPLLAEDVSKFPSSYIMSAEFDVLRDDSFIFASRLKSAGVHVVLDHLSTGWHGVVSYTRTSLGQQALQKVINYLKENL